MRKISSLQGQQFSSAERSPEKLSLGRFFNPKGQWISFSSFFARYHEKKNIIDEDTTRTPRQVPRDRSKPSLCDTGPVPPIPARMKLLALVLALSVNSRPSSLNCAISSPGFRRLPRWRIMATRHSRGALTRSAHDFENCHYKNPYHGQGALDLSWCVGSGQG